MHKGGFFPWFLKTHCSLKARGIRPASSASLISHCFWRSICTDFQVTRWYSPDSHEIDPPNCSYTCYIVENPRQRQRVYTSQLFQTELRGISEFSSYFHCYSTSKTASVVHSIVLAALAELLPCVCHLGLQWAHSAVSVEAHLHTWGNQEKGLTFFGHMATHVHLD